MPPTNNPVKPGRPGRYRRAPGYFPVLSGTAVRQAAARRAGDQRARTRRRLSPVAAVRANCASPTSLSRWTSPSPPHAARPAAPRAAPRPARAASPMICGKNWASRFMCSCPPCRWPMWWRSGCWAAPPCNDVARRREVVAAEYAMPYLRSQCDVAVAPRMPGRDAARARPSAAIPLRCMRRAGRRARWWKRRAMQVAKLAGAKADRVIFTSGGTESNAWRCAARSKARWKPKARASRGCLSPPSSIVPC